MKMFIMENSLLRAVLILAFFVLNCILLEDATLQGCVAVSQDKQFLTFQRGIRIQLHDQAVKEMTACCSAWP
jgi:hypothetical protein